MEFIVRFQSFIQDYFDISKQSRILLTVSGGVDSMSMARLFMDEGYPAGIAHCNFSLRGSESDADEQFVGEFAKRNGLPFHSKRFATRELAEKNGISVQMMARDLRYEWFEELAEEYGYDFVATAHHLDDDIETVLLNLARGTGIRGLKGIPLQRGRVIRPLKFASRNEIEDYARLKKIAFREDSSNTDEKYLRNRIRHHIIPELERLNPEFRGRMVDMMKLSGNVIEIFDVAVRAEKDRLRIEQHDGIYFKIEELLKLKPTGTWLFELLKEFGFSPSAVRQVVKGMNDQPGKVYYSTGHRLVRERDYLKVQRIENVAGQEESSGIIKDSQVRQIKQPISLECKIFSASEYTITGSSEVAALDLSKLHFPLVVRKWNYGDRFTPLGMLHHKKISDFLIDSKVDFSDKEQVYVIVSGEEIVWVVGYRISERHKISEDTESVFEIRRRSI